MKRTIIISSMLIAVATFAIAQQPRRMGPMGPPPQHGDISQFLGLTADQKTQFDALHDALRATVDALFETRHAEEEKLHSLIESATPDATAIGNQALAVHAIDEQIKAAHDATKQKIEAILTADQKLRFEALEAARQFAGPPPPRR